MYLAGRDLSLGGPCPRPSAAYLPGMKILLFALLLFVGAATYIRFSPSDSARWHIDPVTAVAPERGGYKSVEHLAAEPVEVLRAIDAIALATPRTLRLAGSTETGMITYVTRSRLWGFPDYTTVRAVAAGDGTDLTILARLRFGIDDAGVNRARVESWTAALGLRQG